MGRPHFGVDVNDASFTVGDEDADAINVAVQLQVGGSDADQRTAVMCYLSSDSAGDSVAAAPDGGAAIGTDGSIIKEHTAELVFSVVSEADGEFDITITESTAKTFFLNVILPSGRVVTSPAITFA